MDPGQTAGVWQAADTAQGTWPLVPGRAIIKWRLDLTQTQSLKPQFPQSDLN